MVGNHVCKDCVAALEVIEREHLPIEFHDMEKALDYVKEFLKLREGHPEIFDACRKENQIGIPLFVLEDGTVTLDCETAFEAARRVKRPVVIMVGSHLCKACREKLGVIRERSLKWNSMILWKICRICACFLRSGREIRSFTRKSARKAAWEFRCLSYRTGRLPGIPLWRLRRQKS